jgi:uncharacterized damage-inducible protein DinB
MAMTYPHTEIADSDVPRAALLLAQHILDTYASETNKVAAVWRSFTDADLAFRPHERASTVGDILKHQVLSERRFFAEFLGAPEPPAAELLPPALSIGEVTTRYVHLARARLPMLAEATESWWLEHVPFFDVRRERIWVFWRRVLHTAHHRTQLSVYLRLMNRQVPPTYGPTADVTSQGADPTRSAEAASRR